MVLVSQDGIQRPPFHFPKGGHLLQFLSCLENGLLPHGQLDPPLWSQRGKVSDRGWGWVSQGEWSFLPSPYVAFRAHAHPIKTLRPCSCGAGVSQGLSTGTCSFRAKYFPNCASEALRVLLSPQLQTRKMTRPRTMCSGLSTPACSPSSVSCPVLGPSDPVL